VEDALAFGRTGTTGTLILTFELGRARAEEMQNRVGHVMPATLASGVEAWHLEQRGRVSDRNRAHVDGFLHGRSRAPLFNLEPERL
jgi:hypothetical protein